MPGIRARAFAALAVILWGFLVGAPAHAGCAGWNPLAARSGGPLRPPAARDLIELANFGRPDAEPAGDASPFGISPDGRSLAVVIQRADLATNAFCQILVVVDLTGRVAPRILDRGGDFLMTRFALRGMQVSNGYPMLDPARWSPDGRSIAYLKRLDGRTQVWRASLDRPAVMLTRAPSDVTALAWSGDGRSLLYAFDEGRAAAEAAIAEEGRTGWHYDERVAPHAGIRPQVAAPLASREVALDPDSGIMSSLSAADHRLIAQGGDQPLGEKRVNVRGVAVWADAATSAFVGPLKVRLTDKSGSPIDCNAAACTGNILGLWWDGDRVVMLRHDGWNHRYTSIYRWRPGRDRPRLILKSDDVIEGCQLGRAQLICTRQGATRPPRLVALDLASGRERQLLDPNPAFANVTLSPAQRLEWRNARGLEVYGDLVLPPGYKGGRLPVVVTLYNSRGFLRGGTGNDYPIQLLAARGFAVLSIERPRAAASNDRALRTVTEFWQAETRDWAERRNLDSAINAGLDLLIARGIADPSRQGLTGLSDGGSAVRFALINSTRFAAAATSSCCVDEASDDVVGPAWEAFSKSIGYPPAFPVDEAFWKPYSVALDARDMNTPLLMQLTDYELLLGVHAYSALKANDKPVDLYFYPDEFHFKWQPEHRLAVYERNLDWFSFWLQSLEDSSPRKAGQFARWRSLRAARDRAIEAGAASPP